MRFLWAIAALGVFGMAPLDALAQDSDPLALLLSPRGEVLVGSPNSSGMERATWGRHLYGGELIETGDDSSVEILRSTGFAERLGPNSRILFDGSGTPPSANQVIDPAEFSSMVRLIVQGAGGAAVVTVRGVAPTPAELVALSPCQNERVRADSLEFRWNGSAGEELEISLQDENQAVVWRAIVHGANSIVYPADAPALVPGGQYSWNLRRADPLEAVPGMTQLALFGVLTEQETEVIESKLSAIDRSGLGESTRALIRAAVFQDHQMWHSTITTLREIESRGGVDGAFMESVRHGSSDRNQR